MSILLSLAMIVKNEEKYLKNALDGVRDCVDEIVIADTGSTDGTRAIASEYTDRIFDFAWCDDFAAARNFSFSKARGEYIMWLDADDVVTEENARRLNALRGRLEEERPDTVMCRYETAFDGKGRATYAYLRERIVRRETALPWVGFIHECIAPSGKIICSKFTVRHAGLSKNRGRRNLDIYQKHVSAGEKLDPRQKFYYGRELYANRLYTEAESVLREAAEGEGWTVNKIEASKVLADCRLAKGDADGALAALLGSFRFGEPRAEVMCKIGGIFKAKKSYKEAEYWYGAALSAKDFTVYGDFDAPECRGIIPLLELTRCYWEEGDAANSLKCHRAAKELFPEHPSVIYNEKFFSEQGLLSANQNT